MKTSLLKSASCKQLAAYIITKSKFWGVKNVSYLGFCKTVYLIEKIYIVELIENDTHMSECPVTTARLALQFAGGGIAVHFAHYAIRIAADFSRLFWLKIRLMSVSMSANTIFDTLFCLHSSNIKICYL